MRNKFNFKMFCFYSFSIKGCPAIIVFAWSIAKVYAPPLDSGSFNGVSGVSGH